MVIELERRVRPEDLRPTRAEIRNKRPAFGHVRDLRSDEGAEKPAKKGRLPQTAARHAEKKQVFHTVGQPRILNQGPLHHESAHTVGDTARFSYCFSGAMFNSV